MLADTLVKPAAGRFDARLAMLVRGGTYLDATERTVYQSRRLSPGSAIAAMTLAAAAFSSFQFLGGIAPYHKIERRLTVIELADLVTPPPPPPPAEKRPVEQVDERPHVQSPIVAPPPIVITPAPAPDLAIAEVPAPPVAAAVSIKPADVRIANTASAVPSAAATEAGDLSSKMISATPPRYPIESRRLREQGTVTLAVLLTIEGRVDRLSVAKSSGFPRLDHAASSAVRHWRWSPTVREGQAMLVQGKVVIPFILRG